MFPVFFNNYPPVGPVTYIGIFLVILMGFPSMCILLFYTWNSIMDWWDGLFAFNNTGFNTSQTTNNTVYKAPKAKTYKVYNNTYDKWGFAEKDRKEPPKALFFSREGTKSLVVEGPWEEVHLKQVEINCWNNKKRGTGIISTENNTKTAEMDESKAFLEQNDEFKGYRG